MGDSWVKQTKAMFTTAMQRAQNAGPTWLDHFCSLFGAEKGQCEANYGKKAEKYNDSMADALANAAFHETNITKDKYLNGLRKVV